ncbi:MAG: transposase [Limisphaerales bacterium]
MRALKRLELGHFRQGAPVDRKVLWVWDKAGIDFAQWYRWKHSAGIYFVSRAKENMNRDVMGINNWNRNDAINRHVVDDVLVGTSQGVLVRWIRYRDPVDGELIELITSEMNRSPGLIVHLYRVRWDIEKVFDEFKSKFLEKKSWGSSSVAKAVHGQLLCLAHTLLSLFQKIVVEPDGITKVAEDARRRKRMDATEAQLQKAGAAFPEALRTFSRCTQHSLKFIRWLRLQPRIADFLGGRPDRPPHPLRLTLIANLGHPSVFLGSCDARGDR